MGTKSPSGETQIDSKWGFSIRSSSLLVLEGRVRVGNDTGDPGALGGILAGGVGGKS